MDGMVDLSLADDIVWPENDLQWVMQPAVK